MTTDKGAIVVGGGRGMGAAVTRALLDRDFAVAVLDVDEAAAHGALGAGRGCAVVCNAVDEASVHAAVERGAANLPPIRALVTVVGGSSAWERRLVGEVDLATWNEIVTFNLTTMFLAVTAVVPHLRRAGGGSIVAFSSGAGRTGYPVGLASYAAAKAGVCGYARALAWELGPDHIRVNTVSPGVVVTERVAALPNREARLRPLRERQAITDEVLPDDVAAVVAFLASDESRAVTGRDIPVDNGWLP